MIQPDRKARTQQLVVAIVGTAAASAILPLGAATVAAEETARSCLAIVEARIYRDSSSAPIDNGIILMRQGRIEKIGRVGQIRLPRDCTVLNRRGHVVTSGYTNSHVHLTTPVFLTAVDRQDPEIEAELERTFTSWGFTTVFDLASTTAIAGNIKQRIRSGQVKGPRILSTGEPFYPRDATPVYARPFYKAFNLPSAEIVTDEQAVTRAQAQLSAGADGLKLFTGSIIGENDVAYMQPRTVRVISAVARSRGLPVFAHPTDRRGVEAAVENGVTALAHTAPLMGPWSKEFASRIARKKVAIVATLSLFEAQPHPSTPVDVAAQQVQQFYRVGGLVLFGTDAGFTDQFDTRAELRLLGKTIGWRGVLASLTENPAEFLGETHTRGRIAAGYSADLVILSADPAVDPANFSKIETVIRHGKVIFESESLP